MGMTRAQEPETSRDWVKLHMVREQKAVLCASRRPGVCKTHLEDCKTTTGSRPRQTSVNRHIRRSLYSLVSLEICPPIHLVAFAPRVGGLGA